MKNMEGFSPKIRFSDNPLEEASKEILVLGVGVGYGTVMGRQTLDIEEFINENGELDLDALLLLDMGNDELMDMLYEYYQKTTEEIAELRTEISKMSKHRIDMDKQQMYIAMETKALEHEIVYMERESRSLKRNMFLKRTMANFIDNIDGLKEEIIKLSTEYFGCEDHEPTAGNTFRNLTQSITGKESFENSYSYKSMEGIKTNHWGECGEEYSIDDSLSKKLCNKYKNLIPDFSEFSKFLQDAQYGGYFTKFGFLHVDNGGIGDGCAEMENIGKVEEKITPKDAGVMNNIYYNHDKITEKVERIMGSHSNEKQNKSL